MGNFQSCFANVHVNVNNSNEYPYFPEGWIPEEEWILPENPESYELNMEGPMHEWRFMPTRPTRPTSPLRRQC